MTAHHDDHSHDPSHNHEHGHDHGHGHGHDHGHDHGHGHGHDHHHDHEHSHSHDHHHHSGPAGDERWLLIDVGAGTQDLLIYEPGQPLESLCKLVLPSPSRIAGDKVRAATEAGRDIWLYGSLMGGGAITRAVSKHLKAGLKVFAQEQPALTLHDDLEQVKAMGVELSQAKPPETSPIACGDVDLKGMSHALDHFGVALPSRFAGAAQDHGFSPDGSNRITRFKVWQHFLESGGHLADLVLTEPDESLTRLLALKEALPGALIMDSASAALLGALEDEAVRSMVDRGLTVLNVGNGHTVAFLVQGGHVKGVYEHHTSMLNPELLADHLARFQAGTLSHEEVFDSDGHGCRITGTGEFTTTIITGPKRAMAKGLGRMAVVHGDMMLSGCYGLLKGAELVGALG